MSTSNPDTSADTHHPSSDDIRRIAEGFLNTAESPDLTVEDLIADDNFVETIIIPQWKEELAVAKATKAAKVAALAARIRADIQAKRAEEEAKKAPRTVDLNPKTPVVVEMTEEQVREKILRQYGEKSMPPQLLWVDLKFCYLMFMLLVRKTKSNFTLDSASEKGEFNKWRKNLSRHMQSLNLVLEFVHGQTKDMERPHFEDWNGSIQSLDDEICGLVDGESEFVSYEFTEYVQFMVPFGNHKGLDEIKVALNLYQVALEAKQAFEAKLDEEAKLAEVTKKVKSDKAELLLKAVLDKIGGGDADYNLARSLVVKMAKKANHMDFLPEEAIREGVLRKLRVNCAPDDELVVRLANSIDQSVEVLQASVAQEREAKAEAEEAAKAAKDKIPMSGQTREGKAGKPSGKKAKKKANKSKGKQ